MIPVIEKTLASQEPYCGETFKFLRGVRAAPGEKRPILEAFIRSYTPEKTIDLNDENIRTLFESAMQNLVRVSIENILQNELKSFVMSMMDPVEKPPDPSWAQRAFQYIKMGSKMEISPTLSIEDDDGVLQVETEMTCSEKVPPILRGWLEDPSMFLRMRQTKEMIDSIRKHFLTQIEPAARLE